MADADVGLVQGPMGVPLGDNGLEGDQVNEAINAAEVGLKRWPRYVGGGTVRKFVMTERMVLNLGEEQWESLTNAPKLKEAIEAVVNQIVSCRRAERVVAWSPDVPKVAQKFRQLKENVRAASRRLETDDRNALYAAVQEILGGAAFGRVVQSAALGLVVPHDLPNGKFRFTENPQDRRVMEANRVIDRIWALDEYVRIYEGAYDALRGDVHEQDQNIVDARVRVGVMGLIMNPRTAVRPQGVEGGGKFAFMFNWEDIEDAMSGPLERLYTAIDLLGFTNLIESKSFKGLDSWVRDNVKSKWDQRVSDMLNVVKLVRTQLATVTKRDGAATVDSAAKQVATLASNHSACRNRPANLEQHVIYFVEALGIRVGEGGTSSTSQAAPPAPRGFSYGPWGAPNFLGSSRAPNLATQLFYNQAGMNSADLVMRAEMFGFNNGLLGLTSRDPLSLMSDGYRIGPIGGRSPLTSQDLQFGAGGLSVGNGGGIGAGLQAMGYPNMVPDFMNELPRANNEYSNPGAYLYSGDYLRPVERPMESMGLYGSLVNMGAFGERGNVFGESSDSSSSSSDSESSASSREARRRRNRKKKKKEKAAKKGAKGLSVSKGIVLGKTV